jgi:hypothetical protein
MTPSAFNYLGHVKRHVLRLFIVLRPARVEEVIADLLAIQERSLQVALVR